MGFTRYTRIFKESVPDLQRVASAIQSGRVLGKNWALKWTDGWEDDDFIDILSSLDLEEAQYDEEIRQIARDISSGVTGGYTDNLGDWELEIN